MKSTGKSHWERFLAAVAAGDDERAESLVSLLTTAEADRLLALLVQNGLNTPMIIQLFYHW